MDTTFLIQILQIVWINILLSGDNAVVIAMACRSLAPRQRRWGILLGAGAAVGLRVVFTLLVVTLLQIPYLKLIGGLLLLWIAVKLIVDETGETEIADSSTIWSAVRTIAIADMVMSLDNVVAIAAAARGSVELIAFGLALSVPLIVFGATLILSVLSRFPLLVWAGAGLLGWVAGEMIVADPGLAPWLHAWPEARVALAGAAGGAVLVLVLGLILKKRGTKPRA